MNHSRTRALLERNYKYIAKSQYRAKAINRILLCLLMIGSVMSCANENSAPFWSAESSPETMGESVVNDLLTREDYMMYITDQFTGIHYAEAAVGYGAIKLMHTTNNTDLLSAIEQRYQDVPGTENLITAGHVDANVYGVLPLQLYLVSKNKAKLKEGLALADAQWMSPRDDGLTNQTRFWIDDVWMINSLQVQAYRATGDGVYLDRAALETEAYLRTLQQANGLFHHGKDAPFFWGRGNGWVAAGLAELISELPADHPRYAFIESAYKKMMSSLLQYQAEDGMWRQLIDKPESWKESSSTAMFGFAMAVGVKKGILPAEEFEEAYKKAWTALVKHIDDTGKLSDVCVGTGQSKDIKYYLERPRTSGDFHGQAPLLWFAEILLR